MRTLNRPNIMQTFKLPHPHHIDYRIGVKEIRKKCKLEAYGYRHNKIVYGFSDKLPDIAELQSLGLNIEEIAFDEEVDTIRSYEDKLDALNEIGVALSTEKDLQRLAASTEDYSEGVAAFMGKRKPQFKGR